jgi:3-dehydroquinate synthase
LVAWKKSVIHTTTTLDLANQSCPIYLGTNIYAATKLLRAHIVGHQVMVVTQEKIAEWYLDSLRKALAEYQCDIIFLPEGEQYKTLLQWQKIMDYLLEKNHERATTLIALGGGVVGDITGFAAACYQRGVNYIQIPTTLIAQVDAAIGGKTGVNHASGKNMIGAFHQPQCVITDITVLDTLPQREYIAGLAEIIKYGLIADAKFFAWLEQHIAALLARDKNVLLQAIHTCIHHKVAIVKQDAHDIGIRNILNFGHTFGHALETIGSYESLLHGEAVAIGMLLAAKLSARLNWITVTDSERIEQLLCAAGLLQTLEFPPAADFLRLMRQDKKVLGGKLNLILLKTIGQAFKTSVTEQEIGLVLEKYC